MTTPRQQYEAAARDMYATEQRIRTMTQWGRPEAGTLNATILASLEAKRDRETPALEAMREALPPEPSRLEQRTSTSIRFKTFDWQPIGTLAQEDIIPELPQCLRRARA